VNRAIGSTLHQQVDSIGWRGRQEKPDDPVQALAASPRRVARLHAKSKKRRRTGRAARRGAVVEGVA
jgi:hypothetical protein